MKRADLDKLSDAEFYEIERHIDKAHNRGVFFNTLFLIPFFPVMIPILLSYWVIKSFRGE
jgi:hypothetical protein